jgi:hypothetical protein
LVRKVKGNDRHHQLLDFRRGRRRRRNMESIFCCMDMDLIGRHKIQTERQEDFNKSPILMPQSVLQRSDLPLVREMRVIEMILTLSAMLASAPAEINNFKTEGWL